MVYSWPTMYMCIWGLDKLFESTITYRRVSFLRCVLEERFRDDWQFSSFSHIHKSLGRLWVVCREKDKESDKRHAHLVWFVHNYLLCRLEWPQGVSPLLSFSLRLQNTIFFLLDGSGFKACFVPNYERPCSVLSLQTKIKSLKSGFP